MRSDDSTISSARADEAARFVRLDATFDSSVARSGAHQLERRHRLSRTPGRGIRTRRRGSGGESRVMSRVQRWPSGSARPTTETIGRSRRLVSTRERRRARGATSQCDSGLRLLEERAILPLDDARARPARVAHRRGDARRDRDRSRRHEARRRARRRGARRRGHRHDAHVPRLLARLRHDARRQGAHRARDRRGQRRSTASPTRAPASLMGARLRRRVLLACRDVSGAPSRARHRPADRALRARLPRGASRSARRRRARSRRSSSIGRRSATRARRWSSASPATRSTRSSRGRSSTATSACPRSACAAAATPPRRRRRSSSR